MLALKENEGQFDTPADQIQSLQDQIKSLKEALEDSNHRFKRVVFSKKRWIQRRIEPQSGPVYFLELNTAQHKKQSSKV